MRAPRDSAIACARRKKREHDEHDSPALPQRTRLSAIRASSASPRQRALATTNAQAHLGETRSVLVLASKRAPQARAPSALPAIQPVHFHNYSMSALAKLQRGAALGARCLCVARLSLSASARSGCLLVFRRCKPNAIESVVLAQTNSGGRGGIRARFVWGRGRGQCFCGESASARLLKRSRLPIALVTRDIDSSLKHATLARCKQHAALARTPAERQIHASTI